ncbi:Arylsulfotransferase (ASST) [Sebaldella termitidis]|uniref:Arylsulfotransferase n=2 Tax=Sebaldella TaxID=32068 RepID=D1ALB4_SEBTE|nr:Arylsulfotransferase [Sebaldella termitidis ATCC 33386]SUI24578.1 Arylsulfotransferase (ASST) [Sebaldella termitidis]
MHDHFLALFFYYIINIYYEVVIILFENFKKGDGMKKIIILLCSIVLLVSCDLSRELSTAAELNILSYKEEEKLEKTNIITIYGGESKEEYNIKLPKQNNKFVLVDISVNTGSKEKIKIKDFKLRTNEKEFLALENIAFLSVYGYKPFFGSENGLGDGTLIFEIDKDIKLDPQSTQLVYKGHAQTFEEIKEVIYEDNFFDLANTNIEYEESFTNETKIKEYRNKHYDIESPLILLDPYNFAPLTALVMFDTGEDTKIEIFIEGKDGPTSVRYDFKKYKKHHEIPVYGLYAGKNNKVILYLEDKSGKKLTKEIYIQTEELPENFYTINLVQSKPEKMEPGFTFLSTVGKHNNSIIDSNGDIRWYTNYKSNLIFKRLRNGNIIMNSEVKNKFLELDLLGKIYNIYSIASENIHHDILEMENGNFLITTLDENGSEDSLIELSRNSGKIIKKIDLKTVLDQNRYINKKLFKQDFFGASFDDWFHLNAIYEHKDGITLSGRHQSAVIKMSYPELELKWILGIHDQWNDSYRNYLLTPIETEGFFEWQYGQHSQEELPDFDNNVDTIDILLFDNGNGRGVPNIKNYSRAVQYRINEKEMTVTQIWEYGKVRGKDLFSASVGDANYLPKTGNRLISFGSLVNDVNFAKGLNSPRIVEVTYPDSEVAYEVELKFSDMTSVYRIDRMFIYPENYETENLQAEAKVYLNKEEILEEDKNKRILPETEHACIDKISLDIESKSLSIDGWAFLEEYNSDTVKKYLVLYNEDRSYSVQLNNTIRGDVTEVFNKVLGNNKNYSKSGFNDWISLTNLPPGKYKVAVKVVYGDIEKEYKTDYYLALNSIDNTKLIKKQKKIEENIKKDFEKKVYTLDDPMIVKDPYGLSPLTALILFKTDSKMNIEIEIPGKNKEGTLKYKLEGYNNLHIIPVYGLYPDKKNIVFISAYDEHGKKIRKKIKIKTDKVEIDMPKVKILKKDQEKLKKGFLFISSFSGMYAIDLNGDVRWYIKDGIGGTSPITQLENDRFLAINNEMTRPPYYKSGFYELNIMGKVHKEYDVDGVHHDIVELPNKNYIALINNPDGDLEDYMVEINRETGRVVKRWNMKEIFNIKEKIARPEYINYDLMTNKEKENKVLEEKIVSKYKEDWFHQNAVWYDKDTNYLIISSRHQNAVIAIDYNSSEVKWIFGGEKYEWNEKRDLTNKILKPNSSDFDYAYGQHGVKLIDGLLYVYDNGNFRHGISEETNYSRGVIFRIDESDMKVSKVWEYGKENGNSTFTPYIGNIEVLDNDYYLINFGGIVIDSNGKITGDVSKVFSPTSKSETVISEIRNGEEVLIVKLYDKAYISNSYRVNHFELNPKNLIWNF